MAQYTPKTWTTGETILATELNAIEQAAAGAAKLADVGTPGTPTGDALGVAFGTAATQLLAGLPPASDVSVALDPAPWMFQNIVRDPATGAVMSATLTFPDGTIGTYTTDTLSAVFPGSVDAYHVTKGSPTVRTYTQPAVTRDAFGNITNRPALQSVFPPVPYDLTLDSQLLFDYDGDNLGADTTTIASWASAGGKAGYNGALTQSGTAQPLVKANAINGHKAAVFDGVDDYLTSGAYATVFPQPLTILTVAKVATTGATKWVYAGQSSTSGSLELNVTSGGTAQAKAGSGATITAATTLDAYHVYAVVFNGALSAIYRDAKTALGTGTLESGDTAGSLGATRLGRSTSTAFLTGEVARHVAVGRALGASEISDALTALGTRYGISIGA